MAIGKRILEELGLVSVYECSTDVKLLILQRFVRLFGYGSSTLILVTYLQALEITKTQIGLFMTLTLVGDICISFFLTLFADAMGRKAVLLLGAALMVMSGVVFALFGNYWILLAAAIVGVISPSGNEIGPFKAVEESIVAHLTLPNHRSDVYTWYNLCGTAGAALGMFTTGWVMEHFIGGLGWDEIRAYRVVYYVYAAIGVIKFIFTVFLSGAVESEKKQQQRQQRQERQEHPEPVDTASETTTLLGNGSSTDAPEAPKPKTRWLPEVTKDSVSVVFNLCLLFALDAFASGLAPLSWITYFFKSRYNIPEGKLGSLFFTTSIIAAGSMIVATSLAKRIGNIKTMVFTHLPSAIFLAMIPIPNEVHFSIMFLVLRSCTQSMDTAPRSAFLATIIEPKDRTAVMGMLNVAKTSAGSLGPLITGVLADKEYFWVSFVCAGSLKACYDLGLLAVFKNKERERAAEERRRIEEAERQQAGQGTV